MSSREQTLAATLRLARKYKAMGLPVQRRSAVQDAIFWRRIIQRT